MNRNFAILLILALSLFFTETIYANVPAIPHGFWE